jgi:dCTP deaminase
MILSPKQIREELKKKNIKFDPPIEERQWGEASVNLRLGFTFTHFLPAAGIIFRLSDGIGALRDANVWKEEIYKDAAGKARPYILEPGDFVLGMTHERVWIPRHLIGMVEGRSTYARAGLSMHQTAPWLQPGWNGQITLEIRNSGKLQIALTPLLDLPCQVTFLKLTSKVPLKDAYGSKAADLYQDQTSAIPKRK